MAAVRIGQNGAILGSRSTLDAYVGQKIAALLVALRDVNNAKALLDQVADADLVTLGYTDGTNGSANEVGYLRSALADAADLYTIANNLPAGRTLPYDYEKSLRYAASVG